MKSDQNPLDLFSMEGLCAENYVFEMLRSGRRFGSKEWTVKEVVIAYGYQMSAIDKDQRKSAPITYWAAFKAEFRLFLCTKDKKYAALRRSLSSATAKSEAALVSAISAAIGAYIGAVAAVVSPLATLSLFVALRLGREAYCKAGDIDTYTYHPFKDEKLPSRKRKAAAAK
jgi:hypothetical protein